MTDGRNPLLRALDITCGFPGRPDFLKPVRMDVHEGECWGIIGPNGAGKSTLLRLLAGLVGPSRGAVHLEGKDLAHVPARHRAQRIALLPQSIPRDLPATAMEIVLMGRFPHRRLGLFESAADTGIAARAMILTHTSDFAHRSLCTLSGGEAQRVHLAAALAQEPRVLLLDEPTAALDLHHQLAIFGLLRSLADRGGLAVVVVTHDLNLGARFFTKVILLDDGRPVARGEPEDVITPERLEPVYRVRLADIRSHAEFSRWIVPISPLERGT